jgi:hypothetical protein
VVFIVDLLLVLPVTRDGGALADSSGEVRLMSVRGGPTSAAAASRRLLPM